MLKWFLLNRKCMLDIHLVLTPNNWWSCNERLHHQWSTRPTCMLKRSHQILHCWLLSFLFSSWYPSSRQSSPFNTGQVHYRNSVKRGLRLDVIAYVCYYKWQFVTFLTYCKILSKGKLTEFQHLSNIINLAVIVAYEIYQFWEKF